MMVFFDDARERLADAVRRVRPAHVALAGLAAMFVLAILAEDVFIPLAFLGFAFCLLLLWANEFLTLMKAPDDAFPGRFDKVIWAIALLVLPPIGAPIFWFYRRTSWAEVDTARAKPQPRPWLHDWF